MMDTEIINKIKWNFYSYMKKINVLSRAQNYYILQQYALI